MGGDSVFEPPRIAPNLPPPLTIPPSRSDTHTHSAHCIYFFRHTITPPVPFSSIVRLRPPRSAPVNSRMSFDSSARATRWSTSRTPTPAWAAEAEAAPVEAGATCSHSWTQRPGRPPTPRPLRRRRGAGVLSHSHEVRSRAER